LCRITLCIDISIHHYEFNGCPMDLNEWPLGGTVTNVGSEAGAFPTAFALMQNYPNPFNPVTMISYSIPARSYVTLSVFNTIGQKVAEIVNEEKEAGVHNVSFDTSGFSSGVYFYRMQAGSFVETKKMVVLK
jgi:hypothetical protein